MLRRLPERHKHHALHLLNGTSSSSNSFLYGKPHDLVRYSIYLHNIGVSPHLAYLFNFFSQENAPLWPTNASIKQCSEMG